MKAIVSPEPLPLSSAGCLVDVELPVPSPGPRDILVAVRAVSVNPADTKVRRRARPNGSPPVQTSDMAEQGRILEELGKRIDAGHVRTTLHVRRGPISARTLREAHAQIESGTTIGKLTLEGWE